MRQSVNRAVLEQVFLDARTFSKFTAQKVSNELLMQLYDLMKCGPTSKFPANPGARGLRLKRPLRLFDYDYDWDSNRNCALDRTPASTRYFEWHYEESARDPSAKVTEMYKVFGDGLSGNCYKIKLLMEFLDIQHDWIHVDILSGATQSDEFKRMNPNARVPVLELQGGNFLWESNAILNYLAEDTVFLPNDRYQRAQVLQWQFFEQYSHEPYIATARYINKYLGLPVERTEEYRAKQPGGHKALALMDAHLGGQRFFVGTQPTIADISLYAYTHVAEEGGFDLSGYPNIRHWFGQVEQLPGYVTMGA